LLVGIVLGVGPVGAPVPCRNADEHGPDLLPDRACGEQHDRDADGHENVVEAVEEPARHIAGYSNITELASDLYTTYVYPFELAAVLLLIAIISAITLVHRKESRSKRQNISEQVSVQASDRVRLASISSTKTKKPK